MFFFRCCFCVRARCSSVCVVAMAGCVLCGKVPAYNCDACLSVCYCGTECQKANLPLHKKECKVAMEAGQRIRATIGQLLVLSPELDHWTRPIMYTAGGAAMLAFMQKRVCLSYSPRSTARFDKTAPAVRPGVLFRASVLNKSIPTQWTTHFGSAPRFAQALNALFDEVVIPIPPLSPSSSSSSSFHSAPAGETWSREFSNVILTADADREHKRPSPELIEYVLSSLCHNWPDVTTPVRVYDGMNRAAFANGLTDEYIVRPFADLPHEMQDAALCCMCRSQCPISQTDTIQRCTGCESVYHCVTRACGATHRAYCSRMPPLSLETAMANTRAHLVEQLVAAIPLRPFADIKGVRDIVVDYCVSFNWLDVGRYHERLGKHTTSARAYRQMAAVLQSRTVVYTDELLAETLYLCGIYFHYRVGQGVSSRNLGDTDAVAVASMFGHADAAAFLMESKRELLFDSYRPMSLTTQDRYALSISGVQMHHSVLQSVYVTRRNVQPLSYTTPAIQRIFATLNAQPIRGEAAMAEIQRRAELGDLHALHVMVHGTLEWTRRAMIASGIFCGPQAGWIRRIQDTGACSYNANS
jgi:hypothetical protein